MRASAPGQSTLLLLDVTDVLRRDKVEYLVIGALALSVHGVIRASTDADALLDAPTPQLKSLRQRFVEMGLDVKQTQGGLDDPIPGLMTVSDSHGNRVDMLLGLRGLDPSSFARGLDVPFLGQQLQFVGREDFIAMKCFAGGPKDLMDAKGAYDAAQVPLDIDLMRRLAKRFSREAADRLEDLLLD